MSELAPDLDWMLQSGQVSREIIAEYLASEHYDPLYRLALSVLDDTEAAHTAVLDAFAAVLANMYRYYGQVAARIWVYSLALEIFQRRRLKLLPWRASRNLVLWFSRKSVSESMPSNQAQGGHLIEALIQLSVRQRLLLLLHESLGWNVLDIGALLKLSPEDVSAQLESVYQRLQQTVQSVSHSQLESKAWQGDLRLALAKCCPSPVEGAQELNDWVAVVVNQTTRKRALSRGVTYLREMALVVVIITLALGSIWGVNTFWPDSDPTPTPLQHIVQTKIVYIYPTPVPTRTPSPTPKATINATRTPLPGDVFYKVGVGDTLQGIALDLGTTVEQLRELNRLPVGASVRIGQQLLIPGRLQPGVYPSTTPVTPMPTVESAQLPILPIDIMQRLGQRDSQLGTMWFDGRVIFYGPEGYIGPPQVYRFQVWYSSNQVLVLIGALQDPAEQMDQVSHVLMVTYDRAYLANPGEGQSWFVEWPDGNFIEEPILRNLALLFTGSLDYDSISGLTHFQVSRRERFAGVQTLVIDQVDNAENLVSRIWMDERTDQILRRQFFRLNDLQQLEREIVIIDIAYDVDFPQVLFDLALPWRGEFAMDHTGEPIAASSETTAWVPPLSAAPQPRFPLPSDQDITGLSLSLQYPDDFNHTDAYSPVVLLADHYYLGQVTFGNPWTMICARSPDGLNIAYVSQPDPELTEGAQLRWLHLEDLTKGVSGVEDIAVTQFAFAPDNRRIAFFGYSDRLAGGSVYILDLDTEEYHRILDLADAKSLVWSPDGELLALIARYYTSFEDHIVVVNVENGEEAYKVSIDFEKNNAQHWPMEKWDVTFPVEMGGLDICAAPLQ